MKHYYNIFIYSYIKISIIKATNRIFIFLSFKFFLRYSSVPMLPAKNSEQIQLHAGRLCSLLRMDSFVRKKSENSEASSKDSLCGCEGVDALFAPVSPVIYSVHIKSLRGVSFHG